MRKLFLFLLYLSGAAGAYSQTEATLYFMNSVPQVTSANPAFMPAYKFSIGLPALSSVGVTYTNNGFAYNDLLSRTAVTTAADLGRLNRALTNRNYITGTSQLDLFRAGTRVSPNVYLQFSSTAREYSRVMLPREISTLVVQGSAPVAGSSVRFSPQGEGMAYIESAVSAAVKVDKNLTVGVRLKYITGILDATTLSSDMTIATASDNSIRASADMRLRTSGVFDVSHSGYSFGKQASHYLSNVGAGFDLGATYQLTQKISFAVSAVDIGKIYWNNNTYDYVLNKATANYTFSGIDADKLVQGNSAYLTSQGDSIAKRFAFQKQKTGGYTTWLPGKIYVSSTYQLATNLKAGVLVFGEKYSGRFSQGISGSINKNVGRWLSASVSYTVSDRSFNNVGAGFSLNFAPIQFYVVGDNLLNAPISLLSTQHITPYLNNMQVFSLRTGINIIWGRDKDADKARQVSPRKPTPAYIKARKRSG